MTDYRTTGWVGEIPGLPGRWRRMPDKIRYQYPGASTKCPLCLEDAAGNPWGGWFSCDFKGCCVALVNTGEVFVRVSTEAELTKCDKLQEQGPPIDSQR